MRELEDVLERAINRSGEGGALSVDLLDLPCDKRPAPASSEAPARDPLSSVRSLRDLERQAIAEALSACGGNVLKAAAKLGIGRNTLYRKIERYHLAPPEALRRHARGPLGS